MAVFLGLGIDILGVWHRVNVAVSYSGICEMYLVDLFGKAWEIDP